MATCDLFIYQTGLKESKNFAFDNIQTFLSAHSSNMISESNFQYQRFELNKTIKIDKSQVMAEKGRIPNSGDYQYDYVVFRITNGATPPTYQYYYYYITKISQTAMNTITLELKMDVLNTWKQVSNYSETGLGYKLSAKTLVRREHKDRFETTHLAGTSYLLSALSPEEIELITNFFGLDTGEPQTPWIIIPCDIIREYVNDNGYIGIGGWSQDENLVYSPSLKYFNGYGFPAAYEIVFKASNIEIRDRLGVVEETLDYPADNNFIIRYDCEPDPDNVSLYSIEENTDKYNDFFIPDGVLNPYIEYKAIFYPYLKRIVDKFQEGLETYLFKKPEDYTLYDTDGENLWKVIYSSTNDVTQDPNDTAATYINPVKINLVSNLPTTITTSSAKRITITPQYKKIINYMNNREYLVLYTSNMSNTAYIEVNGVQYTKSSITARGSIGIAVSRINPSDLTFKEVFYVNRVGIKLTRGADIASYVDSVIYYDVEKVEERYGPSFNITVSINNVYIGSQASTTSGTTDTWADIDLTDSKLIKAIEFPYCPVSWLVNETIDNIPDDFSFNTTAKLIQIDKAQIASFDRQLTFEKSPYTELLYSPKRAFAYNDPRDISMESKLFHSDFYLCKFVYDSFAFSFRLEDIDNDTFTSTQNYRTFEVRYVCSVNILSKFMFQFNQYVCKREVQDYNNILIVDRNNEVALYNNAFINYIRSGGYSYDTKKANSQNAMNGLLTALSIIGATASFGVGIAAMATPGGQGLGAGAIAAGVGLTTSTIGSIARGIHTAQEQDKAISQKMLQLQNQSMSVSGTEDIDILRAFSGNKAKLVWYEPSAVMKQALWDLFYYCGYATHEQKEPVLNSRNNFNFCQADIVYENYPFGEDIAEEIATKWKEGITLFHLLPNGTYNVEQTYENFETFLLE